MMACASGATFGWRPLATRVATLPATRRPKAFPRERFRTKAMRETSAEGLRTKMGHFGPLHGGLASAVPEREHVS
jgi:hypothetical protein